MFKYDIDILARDLLGFLVNQKRNSYDVINASQCEAMVKSAYLLAEELEKERARRNADKKFKSCGCNRSHELPVIAPTS